MNKQNQNLIKNKPIGDNPLKQKNENNSRNLRGNYVKNNKENFISIKSTIDFQSISLNK